MLLETETLISKHSEIIEQIQSQLRLGRQPYKDHCYPILVKGLVLASISILISLLLLLLLFSFLIPGESPIHLYAKHLFIYLV